MNKKGRILRSILVFSLLMGLILLSGCASPKPVEEAPAADVAEPTQEEAAPSADTSAEAEEPVTISWLRLAEWSAADPAIITAFEESHPGIKVEVEEIPFSELVSQINLRFGADDTSIDVVSADVPLVSSYGYKDWLLPLDGIFSDEELADFLPAALAAGTYNGELLAAPVSTSTQLLYYNADIFAAAGITPPGQDERWTWEHIADVAQQLKKVSDDDQVEVWGFQWEQTTAAYQLLPLIGSLGGKYIGDDGLTVDGVINSQAWIDAATFYYDMYNTYGVSPQGDAINGPDLFVNGNLAMLIAGPWQIPYFADNADFNWGVSRHPYFDGHDIATTTGSWHIGVNSVSEHPEEAKEFVQWISTGEGAEMWWRDGSHDFPAQQSVLAMFATSEEFDVEPMSFNRVAADEATVNPIPRPVTVGYLEYDQIFRDTFQDIRVGTDPETALNTMVERLDSELAKYK
ncbi:MAG TPA: sugar ABC transporter substrate-binding protein [Anaerolineales bacterium]|nr:sugar ABC transporter substrate-binding protein [Anaerolineales bacterium]